MAVKSPVPSTLNPNAPLFVPAAYVETEDFSPEWWCLVQNCPAFRDYWMRERFHSMEEWGELIAEDFEPYEEMEEMDLLEEEMEFIEEHERNSENKEQDQLAKDLSSLDLNSDKDMLEGS